MGAESVAEAFGHEVFDVIHSSNALDHSHDPIAAMRGLLRAIRPGRPLYLEMRQNEGQYQNYTGFHLWNFDLQDQRLVLWRPRGESKEFYDVESVLAADGLVSPGDLEVDLSWDKENEVYQVVSTIWRRDV